MAAVFTDYYDVINVVNNILDILPKTEDPTLSGRHQELTDG